MPRTPVVPAVVIGAGPYGLSVAAHLRGLGIPVRVFGEPMDSWRHQMPAGMYLKSHADAASLSAPRPGHTLDDYCREAGIEPFDDERPVPVRTYVSYGLWFADRLLPDVERVRVRQLRRRGDVIEVGLDTGEELAARSVVVATGLEGYPYIPEQVAGLASHSSQHHELSRFAGSDVVMIGAGQSALEGATLLHEAGARVRLVARRAPYFADPATYVDGRAVSTLRRPFTKLGHGWGPRLSSSMPGAFRRLPVATRRRLVGRVLGPFGSAWLRERFEGKVPVSVGRLVGATVASDGRVRVAVADPSGEQSTLTADHVIAGTGFKVNLESLDFVGASTRTAINQVHGSPSLTGRFESSVPGLFFVGHAAAMTFGPVMRFVYGAHYAATHTAPAIAARAT